MISQWLSRIAGRSDSQTATELPDPTPSLAERRRDNRIAFRYGPDAGPKWLLGILDRLYVLRDGDFTVRKDVVIPDRNVPWSAPREPAYRRTETGELVPVKRPVKRQQERERPNNVVRFPRSTKDGGLGL